jgi:hypothetical protein
MATANAFVWQTNIDLSLAQCSKLVILDPIIHLRDDLLTPNSTRMSHISHNHEQADRKSGISGESSPLEISAFDANSVSPSNDGA